MRAEETVILHKLNSNSDSTLHVRGHPRRWRLNLLNSPFQEFLDPPQRRASSHIKRTGNLVGNLEKH